MGWNALLEDAFRRVFEQPFAPSNTFSVDVLLFYASALHVLFALCIYMLYHPDRASRWEFGKLKNPGMNQGCSLPHSVAWMLFESPSLFIPVLVMSWTRFCHGQALNLLVLLLFAGHYLNRCIVYPLLARKYARDTPDRSVPLPIVFAGLLYTSFNGMLQSFSAASFDYNREARGFTYIHAAVCRFVGWQGSVDFFQASQASAQDVIAAGRYAAGIALFFWGMRTNIQADLMLIKLRGARSYAEKCEYSIPLPSTRHHRSSGTTERQERPDPVSSTPSSASRRRKRSTEGTAFREQQCAGNGVNNGRSAGTGDAECEGQSGDVSTQASTRRSSRRSASLQAQPQSSVHHSFTRTPASAYKIPRGNWFDYVSSPNYFGEVCEWAGFAVACDTYAAFSFAFFTVVFLTRRALAVHRWYLETFGNKYPQERKAILPRLV